MSGTTRTGCARVRARLAIALDGGLAPLDAALDRGHLEACGDCQRERAEHERLLAAIRAISAPQPAELERVSAAVLARISTLRAPRTGPRWIGPASLVAAAAAALCLMLLTARGTRLPGRRVDLATLDRFVERLPSWSDVVRGLSSLHLT